MDTIQALVQHIQVSVCALFPDTPLSEFPPACIFADPFFRKFFTFVITMNAIGILLAALNVWTYPRHYTGAFVLGNLLTAILVRNELFGRFLYLIVNTFFAKVCTNIKRLTLDTH